MAGNRVEYIIDLVASDKQLRQSLAKLDWEKMLGSKGKGFSDVLKSNAEESKQVITSTLGGLHLDWSSILGKEQFDKMQNAIRKTVQQSSKEISALFGKGDFSGILKVINFISDLGEEFKALGGSFDNAGLIRSLGHLMKTVEGVEGATQRVGNTFNLAFKDNKWATKTTQGVERIAKALVTLGADKTAVSNIKGINAELDKISQKSKIKIDIDYSKLSEAELSEKWNEQITVLEDMDDITLDDLIDNLDLYKNRAKELIPVLTNILKIEQAAKKNKFGSFISEAIEDDIAGFGGYTTKEVKDAIKETISNLNDEINKSKEKLQEAVGDLLSGLGTVDLKLSLSDKDKNEFRDSINKYIDELNDSGTIKSINIGVTPKKIDPTKTEETIEPNKKSSEPNGRNEKVRIAEDNLNQRILKLKDEIVQREKELEEKNKAIQDYEAENSGKKNTRLIGLANRIQENINQLKEARASYETLLSMMKDSESAEIIASDWNKNQISLSSMTAKQKEILANTQTWREKMIEAMKFSSDDLAFEYKGKSSIEGALDNLYNDIQTFFNENEINININSEGLAKQIEDVINEKGLTIGGNGGGTATIDASQLASILQAIFTGEPIPVRDVSENGALENKVNYTNNKEETQKDNKKDENQVVKLNREAAQKAIDLLKQFASKADNSKGGRRVADILKSSYGINIDDINDHKYDDNIDDKIFEMLQKALMKPDEKTGLAVGRTLGTELQDLNWLKTLGIKKSGVKSTGFVLEALGRQIDELFSLSGVKTEYLEEVIQLDDRISIFDRVREKTEQYFNAYAALDKIGANKNFKKYIENPDLLQIEDIDAAISEIEAVSGDVSALKQLKSAREKLGDSKSLADLDAFKNSAYEFLSQSKDIYKWLNQQMGNFKGSVKLQGRSRPWNINNPYGVANLPKDAVIEDVSIYRAFGQSYKDNPLMQARPHKQPKVEYLNVSTDKFSIQERSEAALMAKINSNQGNIDEIPQLEQVIEQYKKDILDLSQKINEVNDFIAQISIDIPQINLSRFDSLNNYANILDIIIGDATTASNNRGKFEINPADIKILSKNDAGNAKQLQQYVSDIYEDAVKISKIDAKIQQITDIKSLSTTDLDKLLSSSNANKLGATALRDLEKLRGATLPNIDWINSVIKNFEGAGFNTNTLVKLQNVARNYHPYDEYSPEKEKAKQALEEAFAQFLQETQTVFDEMKGKYGKYDIEEEQRNYHLYHVARWNKSGLDNELNSLIGQRSTIENGITIKQESAKKIIALLQENSDSIGVDRQKEVAELVNKLREIRQSLYDEATKYVDIIRNENTDDATRNIALAKLQQVLGGLKTTKTSFAKIGHLIDVPLYDSKKQSKDVDKWTKEFVENAVVKNILGDSKRQVNNITNELNNKQNKFNAAENKLNYAYGLQQDSNEAKKELEFVQKYNELLEKEEKLLQEINRLKSQGADWKTIKRKYAEKSTVDDEIREFLAQNPNKDRHTYGFNAAEKYEMDIRTAAMQRRAYSKDLAELKALETEIKKSKFFTGNRGKKLLEDYKWSLTQKLLQSDIDNINQNYGPDDLLSIAEKDARDAEIVQAKDRARRFRNELYVNDNGQLASKYSFKNGLQEKPEVIVEDLKQELLNYSKINETRAKIKQELKDKKLDETISELYASKQEAMRYGGVTQSELRNSKFVQEQNRLLKNIEGWESSKKILDEKIKELEEKKKAVGLDKKEEKSLRQAKQQSADFDRKITDSYGFIANRTNLIESNESERFANKKSAEESLTAQTQKLTEQKAKLLAVEKEIKQLQDDKKAAEKGSAEEERIKHEITNKKLEKKAIEERIDKTQEYISSLKKRAEYEKKVDVSEPKGDGTTSTTGSGGILGAITSAVKEALAGTSTNVEIDVSHLATEETLQAIYALLGGDSSDVNREALEEELAKINQELEGEGLGRNKKKEEPAAGKMNYQNAVEIVRKSIGGFSLRTSNANKAEKYNSLSREVLDAANVLRTTKEGVTKEGSDLLNKMYKLRDVANKVAQKETNVSQPISEEDDETLDPELLAKVSEGLRGISNAIDTLEKRLIELENIDTPEAQKEKDDLQKELVGLRETAKNASDTIKQLKGDTKPDDKSDLLARKAEIEGKLSGSSGGGIVGIMRTELAKESTLQKVLSALGEIAKRNAMSGKPNSAQDLLEQFRRMLESDAWEGRERVAYMDLATGSMSNAITGDDKAISAERLRILREAYTGKMDMNAQVHTHANADDPYFSPEDLKQFGIEFANGITKQILLSKNNMTVLDMTDVKDINGLLEALAKTEHNFEALATTADKFGAKYTNKAFDALTPQGLVKMLGIKGIESKLNQEETRDSARTGVAEEDAKEAAKMLQESTGRAIKTTVQRVGVELETLVEKTDTKGNKTWTSEIGNKYQKAMEATNKSIVEQGLGNVFGKGTDAAKALTEYETHYAKLLDLVTRFKSASKEEREGLQAEINALLPTFNEAEKKLVSLIARKDRFVGDDKVVATFGAGKLKNTRKSLEAEARKRYGGKLNPGSNVAFGGYKRGQGSGQLYVDVLKDGTIKQYVLEVDQATGQVKEYVAAENALANAFQNVNKAMKQNEFVLADVAIGNTPEEQVTWMANASAPQLNEYKKAFEEMQNYTAQLWNSKEAPTQQQLDYLMQLSERVIVLGKDIQKTSGEFKNFWAQNPDNVFGIDFRADDTVRSAMERYAQINASANTSKYDFVSFDNDTLKYKLTDVEGNVRNVTMVWDEMYQKVAMVSDRSVSALDPLVAKIEKYKQTIADAKSSFYLLDTDDAKFNTALQEVSALEQKVKDGIASFEELEAARRRAIGFGEDVKKLVTKNAKSYVGTNEINSASRQRDKIIGTTGISLEPESQPSLFKEYISAYDALIAKHQEYVKQNKLNNPKIQEELRQQAASVQKLGRQYLTAAGEAEKLQGYVEQSGDLGGVKQVSVEETKNMEAAMRAYASAILGADLETVKFDSTTQTMTGVFRQNNKIVSDMVVKYNEATESLYLYQKQERESLSGFPALVRGIKEKMKSIMQYVASITSIYRVWGTIKQGITYIKEIDSALTELKKVTDETEESYDKFLKTAAKTADKVGSTIKDVVSSTADWARLNI